MVNYIVLDGDEPKKQSRARSIVGDSAGRPEHDFYPTHPDATKALLEQEQFTGSIWEPACGDGAISKVLEEYDYKVWSSDLIDRGYGLGNYDFLASDRQADNIITNPPFKLAQEFVVHSLKATEEAGGKVAMLCKLVFLEGQKRKPFFENSPLKAVYVFSKRMPFYRGGEKGDYGSSMMAFAWFVWEHGYEGEPVIRWV